MFISRDIKPGNILIKFKLLLTDDDRELDWESVDVRNLVFKVGDLGLARHMPGDPMTLTVAGTLEYWAPEVLTGRYTVLADIYSLAVTMLHVLLKRLGGHKEFKGAEGEEERIRLLRSPFQSTLTAFGEYGRRKMGK